MNHTTLRYHIVLITKGRHPWIKGELERALHTELMHCVNQLGGHCYAINGIVDHVHLLVSLPPNIALSQAIQKLKRSSARCLNRQALSEVPFKWQPGYFASTVDTRDVTALMSYIRHQKEHHARNTTRKHREAPTSSHQNPEQSSIV